MSLNLNKAKGAGPNKKNAPVLDEGSYPARLVQIIDLGVQPQRPFKGEPKPPVATVRFTYELNDEFMLDDDGNEQEDKPRWISEEVPVFPLSSDLAKSTKRYNAIDPDHKYGGDMTQLVGEPVSVVLTKTEERNYVAHTNSVRPKDAAKMADLKNDAVVFSLDSDDVTTFKSFPEWLQNKIKDGPEFSSTTFAKALNSSSKSEKPEENNDSKQEDENSEEDW